MDNNELLSKLNAFTRREHTLDEVYIFSVILCDNDIDRDCEQFSLNSLNQLKKLFVGKTGIFDHNPKGSSQTARIFSTELITDNQKVTKTGEPYTYLKGNAYMVRTSSNADLIKEIDGGIKKEVSISCSSAKKICSICGTDLSKRTCNHRKGLSYNGKPFYIILEDITDAYEWSFVAVPAQVNAGVTKFYEGVKTGFDNFESLKKELFALNFITGNYPSERLEKMLSEMSNEEMLSLKATLSKSISKTPQLLSGSENNNCFKML